MVKKISIFLILIIAAYAGFIFWKQGSLGNFGRKKVYKTQEECEGLTGKKCSFGMCDYKCGPGGYFKGWIPTEIKKSPAKAISSFDECVAAGNPIMESWPRQCRVQSGEIFTEVINDKTDKSNLIKVNSPHPDQIIKSPLTVEGEARGTWYFEASFPVKLLDAGGKELAITPAQAQGDWMTEEFVPFKAELKFEPPVTETGFLVLKKDNPSGLPEMDDELRIPVKFEKAETIKVKVFFNNDMMDPVVSCDKVFPAEREVARTEAVARAALSELLKGPTDEERDQEFYTNINAGVEIRSITIENGVAKADFSERLEYQMGGSCRVSAVRAQIEETLKQFPTVKKVVISVNGQTEDILQP